MSYTASKFMDAPQVGVLVRNGGRLSGYGKDGEREKRLPIKFLKRKFIERAQEIMREKSA